MDSLYTNYKAITFVAQLNKSLTSRQFNQIIVAQQPILTV
jgi:hypothetical protein